MKKEILATGKALNKQEQKEILGGEFFEYRHCWGLTEGVCDETKGCEWYNNCYCGPTSPHIAPPCL